MEDGYVTISRALGSIKFPCRFLLVAASNPCPCGYLGHPKRSCRCSPGTIIKYKKKISGPLLDRIDIHVSVPPVEDEKLISNAESEKSSVIKERIVNSRNKQLMRFKGTRIKTNGEMQNSDLNKYCKIEIRALDLLKQAISRFSLSARSYTKIIKISQTISDLESCELIKINHVAEALQFRTKEE